MAPPSPKRRPPTPRRPAKAPLPTRIARLLRAPSSRPGPELEHRSFPVPDGLDGVRVDAGLAKLLGFSRTLAADIANAGGVALDGAPVDKSDRLRGGAWLEVSWEPPRTLVVEPIEVPELGIIHDDDDLVVVDKPAGVAAHPSLGWNGPTVVGALAAAGFRISTSGAPERQGVVHRLDAGTSGLMVVAKSERAYTELKRQFHDREVEKIYHAVVQGHPDPLRERSTHRSGGTRAPNGSSRSSRAASTRSPTTRRSRRSRRPRCSRCTSRPGAPTRSGCTWRPSGIRAPVTPCTAPTRRCLRDSASSANGSTRSSCRSPTRARASGPRSSPDTRRPGARARRAARLSGRRGPRRPP